MFKKQTLQAMEKYFLKPIFLFFISILAFTASPNQGLSDDQMDPFGDVGEMRSPLIIIHPRIDSNSSYRIIAHIYNQSISLKFEYPIGNITVSLLEYGDNCVFSGEYSTSSDLRLPNIIEVISNYQII